MDIKGIIKGIPLIGPLAVWGKRKLSVILQGTRSAETSTQNEIKDERDASWTRFYSTDVTKEFMDANIEHHKFFVDHIIKLSQRLRRKRLAEIGIGTATMSIYFSQKSFDVTGIDNEPMIVKKAMDANKQFNGNARFICVDALDMPRFFRPKLFDVAFSQGTMEHFDDEGIKKMLKAQLFVAEYVVFSVPSCNWHKKDFGDERLMTKEEWRRILEKGGFHIELVTYYQNDLHVLCVISDKTN